MLLLKIYMIFWIFQVFFRKIIEFSKIFIGIFLENFSFSKKFSSLFKLLQNLHNFFNIWHFSHFFQLFKITVIFSSFQFSIFLFERKALILQILKMFSIFSEFLNFKFLQSFSIFLDIFRFFSKFSVFFPKNFCNSFFYRIFFLKLFSRNFFQHSKPAISPDN